MTLFISRCVYSQSKNIKNVVAFSGSELWVEQKIENLYKEHIRIWTTYHMNKGKYSVIINNII